MTENHRLKQKLVNFDDGDCIADPVPALWHQDDDEYFVESGLIERFWLPLSVAVIAGWGSLSFVLVNTFGWLVIVAIAGFVLAGAAAAVVLVRTGDRGQQVEFTSSAVPEQQETEYRNAA
jgi:hypothetical protein